MKKTLLAFSLFALPVIASAQADFTDVNKLIEAVGGVINLLIPLVFALALLYFFWGLSKFILGGGEDKEKGKNIMIWGIVALFIMASVWGIINFIEDALGVDGSTAPELPSVTVK